MPLVNDEDERAMLTAQTETDAPAQAQDPIDKDPDHPADTWEGVKTSLSGSFARLGASLGENNPIGNLIKYGPSPALTNKVNDPDSPAGYNTFDKLKGTPYMANITDTNLAYVHNDDQLDAWKADQDKHQQAQQIMMSDGPTSYKIAALESGALNPLYYIPFLGAGVKGAIAADALRGAVSGAAYGAGIGALNVGAQALTAAPSTTFENKADQILGNAMYMGIIGGTAGLVSSVMTKQATDYISQVLKDGNEPPVSPEVINIHKQVSDSVYEQPSHMTPGGIKVNDALEINHVVSDKIWNIFADKADGAGLKYNWAMKERPIEEWTDEDKSMYDQALGRGSFDDLVSRPQMLRVQPNLPISKSVPPAIPVTETPKTTDLEQQENLGHQSVGAGASPYEWPDSGLAHLGGPTSSKIISNAVQIGGYIPGKIGDTMISPVILAAQSKFPFVRDLGQKLFKSSLILKKNTAEGGGFSTDISVSELMTQDHQQSLNTANDIDKLYMQYTSRAKKEGQEDLLTQGQFRDELFATHVSGKTHEIPEINLAASRLETQYQWARQELQSRGNLPEDVKPMEEHYAQLVHDVPYVIAHRSEYTNLIKNFEISKGKDPGDAMEYASEYVDKVIGRGDVRVNLTDMASANLYKGTPWLKERTSDMPMTDRMPFLKTDAVANMLNYSSQVSRLIRTQDLMKSYGVQNINDLISKVDEDITKRPELGLTDTDAANAKQLVKDFLDIHTGDYLRRTVLDNTIAHLKFFNYLQLMGSVTVTAITHLGVPLLKYGIGQTLINGWGKMIRDSLSGLKEAKLEDMRLAGFALERTMNDQVRDLIDPTFTDGMASKTQQIQSKITSGFGTLTGMNQLVKYSKQTASYIAEGGILKDLKTYANLSSAELEHLRTLHIDSTNYEQILQQIDKYGDKETGVSNYRLWNNQQAKTTMMAALNKELHNLVPQVDKGTMLPLAQRYKAGAAVMQFTQFFTALTANMIIPAMQARQIGALRGIVAMTALGSLAYVLKETIAGRKPDTSMNRLILEGLSRSALGGLLTTPIFGSIIGHEYPDSIQARSNYYKDSSITSGLLGPIAGNIDTLGQAGQLITKSIQQGRFEKQLGNKLFHLLPGQNIWELKAIIQFYKHEEDQ